MDRWRLAAAGALATGLALLAYGALQGDVRVALLLILPIVYAEGLPATLGILLLMAAGVLWVVARVRETPATPGPEWGEAPRETKSGGIVLVGPIPIAWGSDRRVLKWMVAAGVLLLALAVAFSLARR